MEATSSIAFAPMAPSREKPRPVKSASAAEPLSPFMPWSAEERTPLPELVAQAANERQLLVDLLREPAAVVERLLDPAQLQGLVLSSVGIIAVCTSLFAGTSGAAREGGQSWAVSAALTSVNVLMAIAASLGPIYAASMLLAARLPLARLVAALLAAAAAGSLLLAGMAPPLYLLWKLDSEWAGPLMLCAAFILSGMGAGARIHRLLRLMAEQVTRAALENPSAVLSRDDAFRVGILARVACMVLAFTTALGFWAFQALG